MAVDVAAPAPAPARPRALVRAAAVPAGYLLAGLVLASFAVRWLVAGTHATPFYFSDEYIYPSLAHGLATTGLPTIRGETAAFAALLEPLLAAPFWLPGDTELAYTLTQGMHALAMSLAAVPVYLLCRRLGLSAGLGLGAAAVTVAAPGVSYSGWMLADPVGYPLALAAVWTGVAALTEPRARWQAAFLAFAGLATFARLQYAVLPVLFLVAAAVLERGRVGRLPRRYPVLVGVLAAATAAVLVVGVGRLLGYYREGIAGLDLPLGALLRWLGNDTMIVAYASGWVLVPGALVGLWLALGREASREERAFALLASLLAGALIGEASLWAANAPDPSIARVHERYTMAIVPLVAVAFALYARRGFPARKAVGLLALGLLVLSARVPLSGYTIASGKDDSPTLRALLRLEAELGIAGGSLAAALAAGALAALAAALPLVPRRGAVVGLGATLAVMATIAAGAASYDRINADAVLADALPSGKTWVDDERLGAVSLLQLPHADRANALEQLFWNRSVERVLVLDSGPIDAFPVGVVSVGRDGRLLVDGRVVREPLLVQTWGARPAWAGADVVRENHGWQLLRPEGTPRLRVLAAGLFGDGWLGRVADVTVWPERAGEPVAGTLRLELSLPPEGRASDVSLSAPGVERRVAVEPGGAPVVLELPVRADRFWTLRIRTEQPGSFGYDRVVGVRAEPPVFTPAA